MAKKSVSYWQDRALEREAAYQSVSVETIATMQRVYDLAFDNIQKQIDSATKQLIKKYDKESEDTQIYIDRMKILEILQERVYDECKKLENIEKRITARRYSDVLQQGYYTTMFDIQKGVGLAFDFVKLPEKTIRETMFSGWKGRNFSKSIWNNTEKLAQMSQEIIKAGFLSGVGIETMISQLDDVMQAGKFAAERLIRSETNYFANQGELRSYEEAGIDKYEFLATLDNRTSTLCQDHDGTIDPDTNEPYFVKNAIAGVNYPPLHAFCRSTTVALLDDRTLEGIQRRARDPVTGQTYLVPADMDYKQWYDKYVKDKPEAETSFKAVRNKSGDIKQFEKYKDSIGANVPETFEEFQNLKYNDIKSWNVMKDYNFAVSHGHLSPLVSLEDYKNIISELDKEIVGITTSNGIKIESYSKHFIDRVLGSVEQRRSGVTIDSIKQTLLNPLSIDPVAQNPNGNSQRFNGADSRVTVNPDTGNLIQTNPNKRR